MDIFSALSLPSVTLTQVNVARDEILHSPEYFEETFRLIFDVNEKHAWRFAWAMEKVSEKNPLLFSEKHVLDLMAFAVKICTNYPMPKPHINSLKRSIFSILVNLPVPLSIPVDFINICFEKMVCMKEPIAVQALCMKMLLNISRVEPEFIPEIIATLENVDLTCVSAGYIAMRKNILKSLKRG